MLHGLICDEIISWASTCRGNTKTVIENVLSRKTPSYRQNQAINYDLRQNRLLEINVSKYTETTPKNKILLKTCSKGQNAPRYRQICATGYDLRRNRLRSINVSRYTETVLENVLSVWKNSQIHSKFARKLFCRHERVTAHRNNCQKRPQRVEKPPRYPEI